MNHDVKGKKGAVGRSGSRNRLILATMVSLVGVGSVSAFEIPTNSEDVKLRWDNTLRYTLADRVQGQNKTTINNPNTDDGDRNFDVGIVSNRLDILSEADLVYKNRYGARLSAAAWYDQRYQAPLDNNSVATSNHLVNGVPAIGLSNYTKRYFKGPDGELLDAFVFGGVDIAGMQLNVKVGRHTNYWGESLLLGGNINGIAYAQSPLDGGKMFSMPGVEVKEIFRPLDQVSFQLQPSSTLSIAGMYYLQYETNKFPEAGTNLGFADLLQNGGESLIVGFNPAAKQYVRFARGNDVTPKNIGDWGLSARWSPQWLNGTAGLYYRNFSDKFAQVQLAPAAGQYQMAYASGIDLYGISYATQLLGVSIGSEISYRHNMDLVSDPTPGQFARGNTMHGVVNFLGLINKTPVFDSASWIMEYTWSHLNKVTQGAGAFKGRDSYQEIDKATTDFIGGSLGFTPTWFQVVPGVDLTMPLSILSGLVGNSVVALGGNKNCGTYGAGVGADIFNKYKVNLQYTGFFGAYGDNVAQPGGLPVAQSPFTLLSDRGFVSLTLKATF